VDVPNTTNVIEKLLSLLKMLCPFVTRVFTASLDHVLLFCDLPDANYVQAHGLEDWNPLNAREYIQTLKLIDA